MPSLAHAPQTFRWHIASCPSRRHPLQRPSATRNAKPGMGEGLGAHAPRTRHARRGTTRAAAKDAIDRAVEEYITDSDTLAQLERDDLAGPLAVTGTSFLGGSSWSSAYKLTATDANNTKLDFFVKTARGRDSDSMFKGEALGLTAMRRAAEPSTEPSTPASLAVPKVYTYGDASNGSFIIMEYMKFTSGSDMRALGTAVGKMHRFGTADRYGFDVDNTIGGTPQPNPWMDDWVEFFKIHRLQHQVNLANDSRLTKMCNELISSGKYERLFEGAVLKPALVHGDLWSGNIGWSDGKPALFDPATYYGHSECEFGMSWCAGFTGTFWSAYFEVIPKAPGFDRRHDLYTLYHYLNHYNLFGSGYYGNCERLFSRLLSK